MDHDKPLVFRALLAVDSVEQIGAVGAAEVQHCGRRSAKPSEVRIRRQRQNLACHSVQHTNQSTTRSARSAQRQLAALRCAVPSKTDVSFAKPIASSSAVPPRNEPTCSPPPTIYLSGTDYRCMVRAAAVYAAVAARYIMCCALYGA